MLFGVFIIYQVYMLDPRRMVSVWFLDTSIWTKDRIFIYYPIRPFGHIPVSGIILEFDSIGYDITIFFDNITVFFFLRYINIVNWYCSLRKQLLQNNLQQKLLRNI